MTKKRDMGQELLEGVRAIKAGKGKRRVVELPQDVQEICNRLDLSQSALAALVGISTRRLRDWEQGRRQI